MGLFETSFGICVKFPLYSQRVVGLLERENNDFFSEISFLLPI
jgi:hypothetical protein